MVVEHISIPDMISEVEAYIFARKGVRVKIFFYQGLDIVHMRREYLLLCEAYGVAKAYFTKNS